jgi:hypothetical protein
MPSEKRVFSEQEVSAVVRRAVELQENAGQESYTPGVTPEELERIAAELGIEPRFLQQAIFEANTTESKKGPLNLTEEFERVVDTELSSDDFDVLLKYLRPIGHRHPITQIGRTLTGSAWTGCSMANVEVSSKGGRTRVKVKSNPFFAWLVTLHPAFISSLLLFAFLGKAGLVWLAIGLVALIAVIASVAFQAMVKAGHKSAKGLTEKLAASVAEAQPSLRDNLAKPVSNNEATPDSVETKA